MMNCPNKPLISFILFAYNQEQYIREAVEGALSQTYSPLEVLLSDDCSSDRTFDIMRELASAYCGPHKLILNRNSRNLGIGGHVRTAFQLGGGEWFVLAAGDDISMPERTTAITALFSQDPTCRAVFSDMSEIDEHGVRLSDHASQWPQSYSPTLMDLCRFGGGVGAGAAYAYHRSVGFWPDIYPAHLINEDRLLPLRAALLGSVRHLPQPLLAYRHTPTGLSRSTAILKLLALNKPEHIEEVERTIAHAVEQKLISRRKARQALRIRRLSQRILLLSKEIQDAQGVRLFVLRFSRKLLNAICHYASR